MKTVEVNTSKYLFSHGKEPRGYGQWWFQILNDQYRYQDSYGKAVNAASKEMKRQCQRFGISTPPAIVLLHPITHKSKFVNQINIVYDRNYA